jgi:hypothetical protein
MALSSSSLPPLPKLILFDRLSLITANESLRKIAANSEAITEVTISMAT